MEYFIIAIILFVLSLYLYSNFANIKLVNYIINILYILFIGFGSFKFADTYEYTIFFKYKIESIEKNIYPLTSFEPLFVYYSMIIKYFTKNFLIYQAFTFTIEFFIIQYAIKKLLFFLNDKEVIYLKILLFFPFISLLLPAFRQSFAITIFLYSLTLISDKKYILFIILNIVGLFFHTSLIFCLPLYVFIINMNMIKSKLFFYILFLLGIGSLFFNFSFNFLFNFLEYEIFRINFLKYSFLSDFHIKIGILKKIELIILFYFIFIYNFTPTINIYKSIFILYYFFSIFFTGIIPHRILYYLELFYYIAFFILFFEFSKYKHRNKSLYFLFFPLLYIISIYLFKFINIFQPTYRNSFLPYNNYFY